VEVARLYKDAGVNPLAGCLPTLVTLPVWIGLYRALSNVADEGLLTEGFFWIPSLAGPTSLAAQKAVRRCAAPVAVHGASAGCSRRRHGPRRLARAVCVYGAAGESSAVHLVIAMGRDNGASAPRCRLREMTGTGREPTRLLLLSRALLGHAFL
jgi:membrane protein insertase Oxa1/YidC/SpoIIIJ